MPQSPRDVSMLFIELGAAIVGLAILARLASRWQFSSIPLYLLAGLCFGNGGIAPLHLSENFIHLGAEIGVLLLLFMLGLEYTGEELRTQLRAGLGGGAIDFAFNFTPGLIAGFALGWSALAAVLLGGVTYISSSGIVAKVLTDLRRLEKPETPAILSVLVLEDLAMAVYLPIIAVILSGGGPATILRSVLIAVAIVALVLVVAVRYGQSISRFVAHESDEVILLSTFGTVLLIAGVAQRFNVSSAIGAFLVGIALTGPMHEQSRRLFTPLRDLFAATFFFFFGLEIDPRTLPAVLPIAGALAAVTAATKIATGYLASRRLTTEKRRRLRAGMALIARGEFSIVIAGLSPAVEPQLGPLAAAYVLILAILGPLLYRLVPARQPHTP